MRSSILIVIVFVAALIIAVVGGVGIWFSDSQEVIIPLESEESAVGSPASTTASPPPRTVVKTPVIPPTPTATPATGAPDATGSGTTSQPVTTGPKPVPTRNPQDPNMAVAPAPGVDPNGAVDPPEDSLNWDARVQDVLTSGKGDREIATDLLVMMSQMPPERQGDTAQLLAGLMPDEGYAAIVPLLNNPQAGEEVLDALMVDLLDRPESIQLPQFLNIARNPEHPRHQEALDYLGLHMDADFGTDWGAWQGAIENYLKNPPEAP